MCVVAAKPFVLCALFSLRDLCRVAGREGAGASRPHGAASKTARGPPEMVPNSRHAEEDWYSHAEASPDSLGYWG